MKCPAIAMGMVVASVLLAPARATAQDVPNQRGSSAADAPAGPYVFDWGHVSHTPPSGRAENVWRYRLFDGRWWYWTQDKTWSYFTGDIWVPYTPSSNHYLSRRPLLGPIAGPTVGQGVTVQGNSAGLTLVPGDHPGAPNLKRGSVLPKYLKQETLP